MRFVSDPTPLATHRETKELWHANVDGISVDKVNAEKVQGHERMWFVPGVGSMTLGASLFETRSEAVGQIQAVINRRFELAQNAKTQADKLSEEPQ